MVSPTAASVAGLGPGLAVVAVAGQGLADCHDQTGVGVNDDLVIRGVPVVLGLLRDGVVASGHEGPVDDQYGALGEAPPRLEREQRADLVDDAVGRRLGHPEQRCDLPKSEVRPPVSGNQQHPVFQWKAPRPTRPHRVGALAAQGRHQLVEVTRAQPGERGYPDGSDAVITPATPRSSQLALSGAAPGRGILMLHRRLVRDYEHRPASAESRVYWAISDVMARRLTGASALAWRGA